MTARCHPVRGGPATGSLVFGGCDTFGALGTIQGTVHRASGVDPDHDFHFDPEETVIFPFLRPLDICMNGPPTSEAVEEIPDEGTRWCILRIRALELRSPDEGIGEVSVSRTHRFGSGGRLGLTSLHPWRNENDAG